MFITAAAARETAITEPTITTQSTSEVLSGGLDIEMTTSSPQSASTESTSSSESTTQATINSNQQGAKATKPNKSMPSDHNQTSDSSASNPCVLCLTEEKRLACIPCGHLATCVPCGHSLRSCPICRREIEAFVRIYV